jgi:hypothetical protein
MRKITTMLLYSTPWTCSERSRPFPLMIVQRAHMSCNQLLSLLEERLGNEYKLVRPLLWSWFICDCLVISRWAKAGGKLRRAARVGEPEPEFQVPLDRCVVFVYSGFGWVKKKVNLRPSSFSILGRGCLSLAGGELESGQESIGWKWKKWHASAGEQLTGLVCMCSRMLLDSATICS